MYLIAEENRVKCVKLSVQWLQSVLQLWESPSVHCDVLMSFPSLLRPGVALSEPMRPQLPAADVQRHHPAGASGDLGFLWPAALGAGGPSPEGGAAAGGEDQPVGPQTGQRVQRVEERRYDDTHSYGPARQHGVPPPASVIQVCQSRGKN